MLNWQCHQTCYQYTKLSTPKKAAILESFLLPNIYVLYNLCFIFKRHFMPPVAKRFFSENLPAKNFRWMLQPQQGWQFADCFRNKSKAKATFSLICHTRYLQLKNYIFRRRHTKRFLPLTAYTVLLMPSQLCYLSLLKLIIRVKTLTFYIFDLVSQSGSTELELST